MIAMKGRDSDESLVRAVLAGNADAFAVLINRYEPTIRGTIHRFGRALHNEEEDLLQETVWQSFRRLPTLRSEGSFPGWLRTIAHRHCKKSTLRRKHHHVLMTDGVRLDEEPASESRSSTDVELQEAITTAVDRLRPKQRSAITLHYLNGLSIRDIAQASEVSEDTVKYHVKTGLRRLRNSLRHLQSDRG